MINHAGQVRALQQPKGRLRVLASHDLSELMSSSSLSHSLHYNHMDILAMPQSCNHTHSLYLHEYCCFFWDNRSPSGFCSFATSSVRPALITPQISALPIPHPALFFFMSPLSDISYILHVFLKICLLVFLLRISVMCRYVLLSVVSTTRSQNSAWHVERPL